MMAEEAAEEEEEEAATPEAGWSKKNKNPAWQCGKENKIVVESGNHAKSLKIPILMATWRV